jgi:hypothetical protein
VSQIHVTFYILLHGSFLLAGHAGSYSFVLLSGSMAAASVLTCAPVGGGLGWEVCLAGQRPHLPVSIHVPRAGG